MPFKEDINNLLDKCIILNTYLSNYFKEKQLITSYEILFRVDSFAKKVDMYINDQTINFNHLRSNNCSNTLFINEGVVINTNVSKDIKYDIQSEYYEYNYIYTNLKENLIKEASKR